MKSVPQMILLAACALAWIGELPDGFAQERGQGLVVSEVRPVHPILIRNEHGPLLRVMIDVTQGQTARLASMEVSLDGTDDLQDIEAVELFETGNQMAFSPATPIGAAVPSTRTITLPVDRPLAEGRNVFWLSCRLKDSAAPGHSVSATCTSIATSVGNFAPREDVANANQRIGVALRRHQDDGVHTYRIPALTTSSTGTLLAVYDMRRRPVATCRRTLTSVSAAVPMADEHGSHRESSWIWARTAGCLRSRMVAAIPASSSIRKRARSSVLRCG